ncbi:hypothetical protein BDV98DRAFT_577961 [Pterulicium gracile]|uniref:Uncharacterized protein n=1 Tax=Pterulicium gracile TaxID=1884261 RepID=A0A5C3Q517_9AGAR|nr:hypothetical protein BDV98DRAFT_577961 [Pterula gracilis]
MYKWKKKKSKAEIKARKGKETKGGKGKGKAVAKAESPLSRESSPSPVAEPSSVLTFPPPPSTVQPGSSCQNHIYTPDGEPQTLGYNSDREVSTQRSFSTKPEPAYQTNDIPLSVRTSLRPIHHQAMHHRPTEPQQGRPPLMHHVPNVNVSHHSSHQTSLSHPAGEMYPKDPYAPVPPQHPPVYQGHPAPNAAVGPGYPSRRMSPQSAPQAQYHRSMPYKSNSTGAHQNSYGSYTDSCAQPYSQPHISYHAPQQNAAQQATYLHHGDMQGGSTDAAFHGNIEAGASAYSGHIHGNGHAQHENSVSHVYPTEFSQNREDRRSPIPSIILERRVLAPPFYRAHWQEYLEWISFYSVTEEEEMNLYGGRIPAVHQ